MKKHFKKTHQPIKYANKKSTSSTLTLIGDEVGVGLGVGVGVGLGVGFCVAGLLYLYTRVPVPGLLKTAFHSPFATHIFRPTESAEVMAISFK